MDSVFLVLNDGWNDKTGQIFDNYALRDNRTYYLSGEYGPGARMSIHSRR
jgi:hypothetical protein